jgi:hypothetical protein
MVYPAEEYKMVAMVYPAEEYKMVAMVYPDLMNRIQEHKRQAFIDKVIRQK